MSNQDTTNVIVTTLPNILFALASVIAAISGTIAAISSLRNKGVIQKLHSEVNGRMSQLISNNHNSVPTSTIDNIMKEKTELIKELEKDKTELIKNIVDSKTLDTPPQ